MPMAILIAEKGKPVAFGDLRSITKYLYAMWYIPTTTTSYFASAARHLFQRGFDGAKLNVTDCYICRYIYY